MSTDDEMLEVRSEIAESRARVADTLAELEARVTGKAEAVKRKLNPLETAREYPWLALAAAVGAGVALSASGTDRRAARAGVRAGRRAPKAAARVSRQTVDSAKHALRMDGTANMGDRMAQGSNEGGPFSRLTHGLRDALDARLADMVQQLWQSSMGATPASSTRVRSALADTPAPTPPFQV